METRQQRLVREALEHDSRGSAISKATPDGAGQKPEQTSLREKSFGRTADDYVPRTLTPHEWEAYYRERGVPASHRLSKPPSPDEPSWLRSVLAKLGPR